MKTLLTTALLLTLCIWQAAAADFSKFTGQWEVDLDRTMEEAKKSPKFKPGEPIPESIKNMIAKFKLRFTENEMTFVRGTNETKMPFTVESVSDTGAVLAMVAGNKSGKTTLTLIDGKFLNMKVAGTDDMDFYVWKRTP